jgi:hypothetical protein
MAGIGEPGVSYLVAHAGRELSNGLMRHLVSDVGVPSNEDAGAEPTLEAREPPPPEGGGGVGKKNLRLSVACEPPEHPTASDLARYQLHLDAEPAAFSLVDDEVATGREYRANLAGRGAGTIAEPGGPYDPRWPRRVLGDLQQAVQGRS